VPRGKWSNLSVREEVKRELEQLREQLGFSSANDVIVFLLTKYRERSEEPTDIVARLEEVVTSAVSKAIKEVLNALHATSGLSKRSAWDILVEQKVTCVSGIKRGNPERIIKWLRERGAVIIRTDKDVCAVLPEFWREFKRTLNSIKTPNDQDVLSRLRDERMKKLFTMLREPGALYLDSRTREWVFDYSFIEEPGHLSGDLNE
jgi:hypothetical protein